MKKHKYKLATLVLTTGIFLSACGDGGEEEAQAPEEENTETSVEETGESTDDTTEDSSTEEDTAEEGTDDTTDDTSGESTDDTEDTTDSTDDTSTDGTDTAEDSESTDATGVAVLDQLGSTPDEAVSAAQENFDGDLVELELDQEGGDWVYNVSMENESEEYEVRLLADDLSIMNEQTENNDDSDMNDGFAYEDAIPHEEAVQTAIDEVGGELEGWTLDRDDGQLEYDVEMVNTDSGNDMDVTINAESGEVIETDD